VGLGSFCFCLSVISAAPLFLPLRVAALFFYRSVMPLVFLLYANCLLGCNCLLYVNRLLGYNLVKSGARPSLFLPLCVSALLFLPLCDAACISAALYCRSYFCHSVMCKSILLLTFASKDIPQQSE
jgi:hypothetical protein